MNLVEVATWIQEADRSWHQIRGYRGVIVTNRVTYIMHYVMGKSRGCFNPEQIKELIDMENSYDDGQGGKLCCSCSGNKYTCNKPKDDPLDGGIQRPFNN